MEDRSPLVLLIKAIAESKWQGHKVGNESATDKGNMGNMRKGGEEGNKGREKGEKERMSSLVVKARGNKSDQRLMVEEEEYLIKLMKK